MGSLRRNHASKRYDEKLVEKAIRKVEGGSHRKSSLSRFQAFAAAIAPICQGEYFQDAWALWESNAKKNGFFVEFGAHNGIFLSNTYMLEKDFGWSGILAEPNPDSFSAISSTRSCYITNKCLYSRSGKRLSFRATEVAGLSRISTINPNDPVEEARADFREITVETISLNDLLLEADAPPVIDFMSVDVEGAEFEILSQFDFGRWDVRAVSVEHNLTPQRIALLSLLSSHGYRRVWPEATVVDDWYVRR